jgi:phosphoglycolate phosphatase-like HAD superfamily hydrolase
LGFDREWALALIARALNSLEQEHSHKPALFAALKLWIEGGATSSQAEVALALEMSETAVKVAVHRLRTRFRELIRAEITATVNDPADVADKLRHFIAVVSSS